jgi:putative RecB family exonuclease
MSQEETRAPVDYRSVSQVKQWDTCPYQYWLQRRERAWQRPAAWLPQGTAVHKAAEVWELSERTMSLEDAQDTFRDEYVSEVGRMCAETPNLEYWFASGPYGGQADLERRFSIGLQQVGRYLDYYQGPGADEVMWRTPEGTPAVELSFDIDLDGVRVRGYIDAVPMVKPIIEKPKSRSKKDLAEYAEALAGAKARPIPRDNKTGNMPGDDFQLGVYDVALEDQYGIKADEGDYWMGKSGKPTFPYDLSRWTRQAVTEKFKQVDAEIRAEKFDPKPDEKKCNFCPVATACEFRFSG